MASASHRPLAVPFLHGLPPEPGSTSPHGSQSPSLPEESPTRPGTPMLGQFGLEAPRVKSDDMCSERLDVLLRAERQLTNESLMAATCSGKSKEERLHDGPSEASWKLWRQRLWAYNGPGWLMMIAYIDPGNLEADLQSGAQFNYSLLWALLGSTLMGLGLQLVAMRLGCVTRRHLAIHCREHYSMRIRILLWLATELAIVGSDIQEVIGCSIGLELLFGLPLWMGVIVTAGLAFILLFLERLGARRLEALFGVLIAMLTVSMLFLFVAVQPDKQALAQGLFEPTMPNNAALLNVVGMLGCVIMPHNLFLHSALVNSRTIEPLSALEAVHFFTIESTAAILTSLLINMSCVAVFAKGFFGTEVAAKIGLRNAGTYLGDAYAAPLRTVWALGLIASGQSSTMTGTYAGQWVMQGYLDLKVEPWKRAVITRSFALLPTLMVAMTCREQWQIDVLNGYLNVLQALVLPFAMVPLILFASSRPIMGSLVLSPLACTACWLAFALVMVANVVLLMQQAGGAAKTFFVGVVFYGFAILYVARSAQMPSSSTEEEDDGVAVSARPK